MVNVGREVHEYWNTTSKHGEAISYFSLIY